MCSARPLPSHLASRPARLPPHPPARDCYSVYHEMTGVYKTWSFDGIASAQGKVAMVRLFLDTLLYELHAANDTQAFMTGLAARRFSGLEDLFPPREGDDAICAPAAEADGGPAPRAAPHDRRYMVATARHVYSDVLFEAKLVRAHFLALGAAMRALMLDDFVETIIVENVGTRRALAFMQYCFQGAGYYPTKSSGPHGALHRYLWTRKSQDGETEHMASRPDGSWAAHGH